MEKAPEDCGAPSTRHFLPVERSVIALEVSRRLLQKGMKSPLRQQVEAGQETGLKWIRVPDD